MGSRVKLHRTHRDLGRGRTGKPTPESAQTRGQFLHVKGLGQVVIGTQVETGNLVVGATAGRQYQHRQLRCLPPDPGQYLQAIHVRQPQVQYHHVGTLRAHRCQRLAAGGHRIDDIALPRQRGLQARRQ